MADTHRLLTNAEQVLRLKPVKDRVPGAVLNDGGKVDVASLRRGNREVCFPISPGGFDLWLNRNLHHPDASEEDAVRFLSFTGN